MKERGGGGGGGEKIRQSRWHCVKKTGSSAPVHEPHVPAHSHIGTYAHLQAADSKETREEGVKSAFIEKLALPVNRSWQIQSGFHGNQSTVLRPLALWKME